MHPGALEHGCVENSWARPHYTWATTARAPWNTTTTSPQRAQRTNSSYIHVALATSPLTTHSCIRIKNNSSRESEPSIATRVWNPLGRGHHEHMKRIFTLPLNHWLSGTYSQSRRFTSVKSVCFCSLNLVDYCWLVLNKLACRSLQSTHPPKPCSRCLNDACASQDGDVVHYIPRTPSRRLGNSSRCRWQS